MSMTTNSNTADDAIFDNDSDVTDVDTGAVGVTAVRTPNRASAGLRVLGGVADDPCTEPVPAPEVAWLSSSPAARARPSSNCASVDDFDLHRVLQLSFAETRKPVPGAGARAGAATRGHQRSTGRADHDQHQPGSGRLRIGVRSALTRYQGRRRQDCRPVCTRLASPARFQAPRQRNLCYRGDAEVGGCAGLLRGRQPAG
jgi:hypothetical protein